MSTPLSSQGRRWASPLLATFVVLVLVWILATRWAVVVHGHPAYAVLIGVSLAAALVGIWRWSRAPYARPPKSLGRRLLRILGFVGVVLWVAMLAWLRPFTAGPAALSAMHSDANVRVTESPTRITLTPTGPAKSTGVLFQPGARVDARAYAAHLRPIAEAGYPVVIVKQPLGIAFLAVGALDSAASDYSTVHTWVGAGHSLGGTVAAMEAVDLHNASPDRLAGLVFWASYPAGSLGDLAPAHVLSVSGSRDGLATPTKIAASRTDLPTETTYDVIDGGGHAQFGDYGLQPGDGTPTISNDQARAEIGAATLAFLNALPGSAG